MAYYKPTMRRSDKSKPGKYYPMAYSIGRVTTEELSEEIAEISTVSPIDTLAVLKALNTVIGRHLAAGQTVQLKGLCNVRLTIQSKGAGKAKAEDVGTDQISGYRVVFGAERQNSAATGKGYALDLSRLRWQLVPGIATASSTPSSGGDTPEPTPDTGGDTPTPDTPGGDTPGGDGGGGGGDTPDTD